RALNLLYACPFILHASLSPPALPSFPTRRSSDLKPWPTALSALTARPPIAYTWGSTVCWSKPRTWWFPGSTWAPIWGTTCCIPRSEEHTSELQSREKLVCRLLLEKKKKEYRHGQS